MHSDVLFIIGAITQTAAQNLAAMYAGRLVMGFGWSKQSLLGLF